MNICTVKQPVEIIKELYPIQSKF